MWGTDSQRGGKEKEITKSRSLTGRYSACRRGNGELGPTKVGIQVFVAFGVGCMTGRKDQGEHEGCNRDKSS